MPIPKRRIRICAPRKPAASSWVELERQLDRLPGQWHYDNPLKMPDLEVIKYRETENRVYFMAQLETERQCSQCPKDTEIGRNGLTEVLKIKDMPVFKKLSVIYYRAQRYQCPGCGKTYQAVSDEICKIHRKAKQSDKEKERSHRMTRRLHNYIQNQSLSTDRSFRDLADEVGVEEHVVRNIFTDYAKELQKNWIIKVPAWIAIDEVYTGLKKKMRCVISSPLDGEVLETLPDNHAALDPFFIRLENHKDAYKIEVVSMDMSREYRKVVRRRLPHAAIVVDRYHAQKLVNEAFKEALVVIRLTLTKKEQEKFMCPESFLLEGRYGSKKSNRERKDSDPMSPSQKRTALEKFFNKVPDIAIAYNLKEDFAALLHLKDYDEARKRFFLWLEQVKDFAAYFNKKYQFQCQKSQKTPFDSLHGTMNSWKEQVLNYVKFRDRFGKRVTNAFAESINRKIKKLDLLGYGYNFKVMRDKIVFGGILRRRPAADPVGKRNKRCGRRRGIRCSDISKNSNVRQLIKVWEDSTGMVDARKNPIHDEGFASRFDMIEIIDDPEPLEWRTRFTSTSTRFKPGVMEKVRGENVENSEEAKGQQVEPKQKDLLPLFDSEPPVSNAAPNVYSNVDSTIVSPHVDKIDDGGKCDGIQPSLF